MCAATRAPKGIPWLAANSMCLALLSLCVSPIWSFPFWVAQRKFPRLSGHGPNLAASGVRQGPSGLFQGFLLQLLVQSAPAGDRTAALPRMVFGAGAHWQGIKDVQEAADGVPAPALGDPLGSVSGS